MKHLKTYKIFENETKSFDNGDEVMIFFKIPGTDKRELIPVKILNKVNGTNSYLVSFNIEENPIPNHKDLVVKNSKIIGPYHAVQQPSDTNLHGSQPVGTDYNQPDRGVGSGGVSNDVVLPNS